MFQAFMTHAYSITVLFPICVYAYALFSMNCFSRHCYDSVITIQIFDFKKSIIIIKRFLVMILNLFLTSE